MKNQYSHELKEEYIEYAKKAKQIWIAIPEAQRIDSITYKMLWKQAVLAWFWNDFSKKMDYLYRGKI